MRILGIDPGLAIVGFGLIEAETGKMQMLQYGAVTTPAGLPPAAPLPPRHTGTGERDDPVPGGN